MNEIINGYGVPVIVGDEICVSEILSGAGISSGHCGVITEITEQVDKEAKAYFIKKDDEDCLRLVLFQTKWGWAYDYKEKYKLSTQSVDKK